MSAVVLKIILPLFGIMAAGYLCGRLRILPENSSEVLGRFVFVIALPALIVVSLARMPMADFFAWHYIAALGGGMLATYAIAFLVARRFFPDTLTAHSLHALTAMFSSTGYVGLPLILFAFGDAGLPAAIFGVIITSACFLPLTVILSELDNGRREKRSGFRPFATVLVNPLFLATAAGLAASATGTEIPGPAAKFCELLGGAYIPCALFSAGLFMSRHAALGGTGEVVWLIVAKLFVHPLITWWLAYKVMGLEGILPAIAVLQAALPSGVPAFVLAQSYRTFEARSNAVIVISTALSIVTLTALLILLEVGSH